MKMNLKTRKTTDFFSREYCDYSSYDNLRKIASLVDGQKNAARKILWYTLQKNQRNEIKVSQLNSKVAEDTEYLHGDMSGVIVNLAKDYTGTNNINLMYPEGNFGTVVIPEASAPRYIYTYGTEDLFNIFTKDDNEILEHQIFEGHKIEPKFMLPNLPMLLVNGAEGISSGYAQKILPRNPDEIKEYLKYRLSEDMPNGSNKSSASSTSKKPFQNKPFYKGFTGAIKPGAESKQWEIYGVFKRVANKVYITELPIGYSLKSYIKVLNKLEDDKIIIGYEDNTDKTFNFTVQFNRKYLDSLSDEKIIDILKLKKKVTENYTVMDQFNVVRTFESIGEIFDEYYNVKIDYLHKRKEYLLKTITQEIRVSVSKYMFIKAIQDGTLIITKRPTEDIIADLDKMDKVIKLDDGYDYLLNMSIRSLTKERMQKLLETIKKLKLDLDTLNKTSVQKMWLNELK